jgi:hypothetical protein
MLLSLNVARHNLGSAGILAGSYLVSFLHSVKRHV